ncbi:SEL1-like repeat protein [Roseisalinus antarcticus]|uniref:SEL1-like repeat protein n=1 Tax=Roseisalinus antarcticus TaxID=254357 RepID=UPI000A26B979|nr:SEL1-like repeat protein [Roseisalinus antarcticus]
MAGVLAAALGLGAAGPASAQQGQDEAARLVFLAAAPGEGRPASAGDDLKVLTLDRLPEAGEAELQVLAALLRSNPVSTFVATPDGPTGARTGDLHLVLDLALAKGEADQAVSVSLGGETMPLDAFAGRLSSLVSAFNAEARQMAYLRIDDPEDLLAAALADLRGAIEPSGFAMSILMVGADPATCEGPRAPVHYAIIGGIADSDPFGDGDGDTTIAEATAYVSAALQRNVTRQEPCAARYSLILRGDDDPARAVVRAEATPIFPDMETAVYQEKFQALFLMSADEEGPIRDYLQTCTYCPSEAALSDRLREIGERQLALRLETGIWEGIRDDTDPGRITVYLENCKLCAFRDEAEALIARLEQIDATRDAEAEAFRSLAAARDLTGLRGWIADCVACLQREEAAALVSELEADTRVQAEAAALDEAVTQRNAELIEAWLQECEVCAAKGEAEAALAGLQEQAVAATACLTAAGLPQQGGPRLLSEINQMAARALCGSVLAAHPGNPLAITALGRVEQAAGNMDEARAAYEAGIEAGIAAAYGLAAHSLYAPGDGNVADYTGAEQLAREGHARGDWLSGEVLTVLYSRELIEGQGADDAFAIALRDAESGNSVAQFFTGYFYRIGAGVPQSDSDAVAWLTQSVDQGYVHANSFLAEIFEEGGEGVPQDTERAAELYWAALSAGDPTALDRLANQINDRPSAIIGAIQTRLRDVGAFSGRVDGIGGNNTASAIRVYANSVQTAN